MQSIQVQVGETARSNDGLSTTKDTRRTVEFEGKKIAEHSTGDTRGSDLTLYETQKGHVVHEKRWSRWQGEGTSYDLHGPYEDAKELSDDFPALAKEAGIEDEHPASLDDVL